MPGQCEAIFNALMRLFGLRVLIAGATRKWVIFVWALCGVSTPATVLATDLSEKLKAVYIVNIARFASWPTEKNNISLCIYTGSEIYTQTASLHNISIGVNRRLKVITDPADPSLCKLIYWDKNTISHRAYKHDSNILEISDLPNAFSLGMDIELFVIDNKLHFSISHSNLANSGFDISSKLLRLSKSRTAK